MIWIKIILTWGETHCRHIVDASSLQLHNKRQACRLQLDERLTMLTSNTPSFKGKLPSALLALQLALCICQWAAAGARDLAHEQPATTGGQPLLLSGPHIPGRVLQQASTSTASYVASNAAELIRLAARQDTAEAEINLYPKRAYVLAPFVFKKPFQCGRFFLQGCIQEGKARVLTIGHITQKLLRLQRGQTSMPCCHARCRSGQLGPHVQI